MKFNIKKLDLFQQLGFLIIFSMMSFSTAAQTACDFTPAEPITISQTTAFNTDGTQYYYLFDCDGNLIEGGNTTADFGLRPYGCYEVYAVNSCPGTAPEADAGITIASPGDITGLSATDYASASTGDFTVCDPSILDTACEGTADDITIVSIPNSYDVSNDMTYVLVCSVDGSAMAITGAPVTVSAGTTPAQASFTTPVDPETGVATCTVYALNHCSTADLSDLVDGADWATVDPSGAIDVTSVSAPTTIGDCILPLDLLSFDASCDEGRVSLEWVTATEDNVKHMVVQRSVDGDKYSNITTIAAKSNGLPVETTYNYVDAKPLGRGFYRLKIVDADGSFEYSPLKQVKCTKGGFDFTDIFPNPTKKDVTVNFEIQNLSANVTLQLVDVLGRVVYVEEIAPVVGNNTTTIDMSKLGSAIYTVILDDGNRQITRRIVKN